MVNGRAQALLGQYLRGAKQHRVKHGAGRHGGKRGQRNMVYFQAGFVGAGVVVQCQVRRVKKPSGALPGKVVYTDYKTILAEAPESVSPKP